MDKLRIDKWLWAARFFKTRSLATDEIHKGRIQVNAQVVKPARDVRVGDLVAIRRDSVVCTVRVLGLSDVRGPAPIAQQLYEETSDSVAARALAAEQRRFHSEPAHAITEGRPTKRDRRELDRASHPWDERWSAGLD